ncbi:unnamed protein product [Paramecium sonneborni]|uniref:Uncharacterized protein n=1 Tax=Paramecium sonneborni TaxID=65129 RepID=A0A8S1K0B1_9CILI|nr:unnamed protein product [Paramecium sonneborni]CAD8046923.1 unnamed protein product [Paramecium sonneborni]
MITQGQLKVHHKLMLDLMLILVEDEILIISTQWHYNELYNKKALL